MRGSDYHCVAVEGGHGIPKPPPLCYVVRKRRIRQTAGTGCNGPGTGRGGCPLAVLFAKKQKYLLTTGVNPATM